MQASSHKRIEDCSEYCHRGVPDQLARSSWYLGRKVDEPSPRLYSDFCLYIMGVLHS